MALLYASTAVTVIIPVIKTIPAVVKSWCNAHTYQNISIKVLEYPDGMVILAMCVKDKQDDQTMSCLAPYMPDIETFKKKCIPSPSLLSSHIPL